MTSQPKQHSPTYRENGKMSAICSIYLKTATPVSLTALRIILRDLEVLQMLSPYVPGSQQLSKN